MTRGNNINCSVSSSVGTATIIYWKFAPTPSLQVGQDTFLHPTPTSATWFGKMVVGGTLQVKATVDGDPAPVYQLGITVSKRTWEIPVDTQSIAVAKTAGHKDSINCFDVAHNMAFYFGWVIKPNNSACAFHTELLYPYPSSSVDTPAVKISQLQDGGPNGGVWYAESLKTRLYQRMQLIRDFRFDAAGHRVRPTDSVAAGCRATNPPLLGPAPDSALISIGTVDSVCMGQSGFRHRVDSLWSHERCHTARAVWRLRDTLVRRLMDSVENSVATSDAPVRNRVTARLREINDTARAYSLEIDQPITVVYKWPTYWGRDGFFPNPWRRRADSLSARITPSDICPFVGS